MYCYWIPGNHEYYHFDLAKKTGVLNEPIKSNVHLVNNLKIESELNGAFVVELFDMIETTQPQYWIYGHHHRNVPDFKIGNTLMLTNQLGYVNHSEHLLFNTGKIL